MAVAERSDAEPWLSQRSASYPDRRDSPTLFCEPPLRRVSSFLAQPSSPATRAVRLDEPIWNGAAHLRLLVHAVQLHTLLERETVGDANDVPRRLDEVCNSRPRVAEILEEICTAAALLQPDAAANVSPMPLLDETGLSSMCPLVAHYLGDPDRVYRVDSVPVVREYLDHVAALNQLMTIAMQLRRDINGGQHKYTAHKIALLYHAINNTKLAREVCTPRRSPLSTISIPVSRARRRSCCGSICANVSRSTLRTSRTRPRRRRRRSYRPS